MEVLRDDILVLQWPDSVEIRPFECKKILMAYNGRGGHYTQC